jgi:glycosyltransferase involved in cell wall biosynthesis
MGRIIPLKGLDHAIAATRSASDKLGRELTLVVAGDGSDLERCKLRARANRVTIDFLGWIDRDRRIAEMRAADLLIVPSIWPDPFGLVGIEAGCVGLPAVAYAVGGITDWLIPGQTGELAPGTNPKPNELAIAMATILQSTEHRYQRALGAWRYSERFSRERHLMMLSRYLNQC